MNLSDRRQRFGTWGLRWVLLAAIWLALADTRVLPELVAAAVTATLGAIFAGLLARAGAPSTVSQSVRVLRLGPRRLLRPLARLVSDTAVLGAGLWRHVALRRSVRGSFRAARHRVDPALRSAAGRTATEAWGSLMPNRYVVGVDDEAGLILVHELVRTEAPLDPLSEA